MNITSIVSIIIVNTIIVVWSDISVMYPYDYKLNVILVVLGGISGHSPSCGSEDNCNNFMTARLIVLETAALLTL